MLLHSELRVRMSVVSEYTSPSPKSVHRWLYPYLVLRLRGVAQDFCFKLYRSDSKTAWARVPFPLCLRFESIMKKVTILALETS